MFRLKGLKRQQDGSIIVTILVVMIFLTAVLLSLVVLSQASLTRARGRVLLLQAQYAAESGADAAIAMFNSGNSTYTGDSDIQVLSTNQYKAKYSVSVSAGSDSKEKILTAVGKVYAPANATSAAYQRTIRVVAQRTSTTTASAMTSRNIIDVDSGVKNITGKDVYLNGFITMHKNTTNFIAENITVGGKNTGATNCSIGGTGNLIKPTSFTTPGQTKTKLTLAYNNCISPPGNTSNANFDVLANQGYISPIQSMYVPWSQYMNTSYTNAGSCSDWTTGSWPRSIPSVNGSKATHYPDSSSNVSSSCGSSGNLALGSANDQNDTEIYQIKENVHIRANLCAASACTPMFNNPTSTTKYIFVEGTVNFDSVYTTAASGPIVLIVYGADPASKASVCPYGGALYIGKNGDLVAPDLYLLAMNGLCLDKTKFGADPALGGLGGKNIYVSTNSGTPFDLSLDRTFPVNEIPIDLAWRAARYERL